MITLGFEMIFWIMQKRQHRPASEHDGALAAGLAVDFAADVAVFVILVLIAIRRG